MASYKKVRPFIRTMGWKVKFWHDKGIPEIDVNDLKKLLRLSFPFVEEATDLALATVQAMNAYHQWEDGEMWHEITPLISFSIIARSGVMYSLVVGADGIPFLQKQTGKEVLGDFDEIEERQEKT